jgi:predicted nucleic acid-binding protein
MIVVDSSVWIDYFTGMNTPGANKLDFLLGEELVAIGELILIEVLQGFRADKDFRQAKKLLLSLTVVNMLDTTIALRSAANFRALRKKGITVRKSIDAIIATYCIENRLPLLHSDKDFQPFHKHLKLMNALAMTL